MSHDQGFRCNNQSPSLFNQRLITRLAVFTIKMFWRLFPVQNDLTLWARSSHLAVRGMYATQHLLSLVRLRRPNSSKLQVIVEIEKLWISPGSGGEPRDKLPQLIDTIWLAVCLVNYPCNYLMSSHFRALEIKKTIVQPKKL